jgi:hypothetical protein
MGTWIGYRHRTKDFKKIKELIKDLKIFAENSNRKFKIITSKGFSSDDSNLSDSVGDKRYSFNFHSDYPSDEKKVKPSQEIYIEFEVLPGKDEWYGVGWFLRDGWWIANDAKKIYPGTPRNIVVEFVVKTIGILEYIKSRYFPDFKIDDEFNFHFNYDEKSDSYKEHLKLCSSGHFDYLKQKDGTFKDYVAKEKKIIHHDPKNILKEVSGMDNITGFINRELKAKGFDEKNIVKPGSELAKKLFPPEKIRGSIKSYDPVGDKLVKSFQNTISGVITQEKRKKIITLRSPKPIIRRVRVKRKDGVIQHYNKMIK